MKNNMVAKCNKDGIQQYITLQSVKSININITCHIRYYALGCRVIVFNCQMVDECAINDTVMLNHELINDKMEYQSMTKRK